MYHVPLCHAWNCKIFPEDSNGVGLHTSDEIKLVAEHFEPELK